MSNAVLGWIRQVLRNLLRTFSISTQTHVDKNDPWTGILASSEFAIHSTSNREKGYSLGHLIFGRNMIISIKHTADWQLIRQKKKTQINKYIICKNRHIVDYDYKVGDDIMLTKHTAYKY